MMAKLKKYPKDDWSKYDTCGNCKGLNHGICRNPKSEFCGDNMPCWYGCEAYIYRWIDNEAN